VRCRFECTPWAARVPGGSIGPYAPVVSIVVYNDFEAALALINASDFGLQAGVYTNDIRKAMQAVDTLEVGGVMINATPTFRLDHFPN
jgi:acyl-CoA reductase-like NAD-dependent aldehyde dehydrogenase